MMKKPDKKEIEDLRDDAAQKAIDRMDAPANLSYAEGVRDALAWILNDGEKPEL